jgi:hypothetical protein
MLTAADFDAASTAWLSNKIRRGPMLYYTCRATTRAGHPCTKAAHPHQPTEAPLLLCHIHRNYSAPSKTSTTDPQSSASRPESA